MYSPPDLGIAALRAAYVRAQPIAPKMVARTAIEARSAPGTPYQRLKEMNSKRSLESRLHNINTGPVGRALNTEQELSVEAMKGKVNVFEIGQVDSLKDQKFLAELLLLYLWNHDKSREVGEEKLRRLIVVEEAHSSGGGS
jgi:hypothetical protein